MICQTPLTIKNPKKVMTRKDTLFIDVPCGRCLDCLKKRTAGWVFRLQEEQKVSTSSHFITLTYDDDHIKHTVEGLPTLQKRDFQLFMKRLRKISKDKLKYYAIGEYGGQTKRPHYHAILFNLRNSDHIQLAWNMGHVRIDVVNVKTITYVANYTFKQTKFFRKDDPRQPEFSLMSKKMGLSYLTPQKKNSTQTTLFLI